MQNTSFMIHQNLFQSFNFVFIYFQSSNFSVYSIKSFSSTFFYMLWLIFQFLKFFFKFFKFKNSINDWKTFFQIFFSKNFNKIWRKCFNWINLKLKGLKWTKTKLKNWNEFRSTKIHFNPLTLFLFISIF